VGPSIVSSFAYPFSVFFQPGIFWPGIVELHPLQVVALVALLASIGAPSEYRRIEAVRHPAVKWMVVFLIVQAISVYRAGFALMLQEFFFWSVYALFVFVSLRIITGTAALRRYVWGVICGGVWIIGYGIYAVHAGLNPANGGRAGAYGMYENHNDYSFIILQTLPFAWLYLRAEKGLLQRSFLAATVLLCVAGIFLSLSRGGMLALVLELALIVAFSMTPRWRLVLLPLVLVVGAAAVSYQYVKRAENQGQGYTAEDAETSRLELWRAGRKMIEAHPWLGVGSRTFGENAQVYAELSHDNIGKNAHNTYIDIAATSGLLGLIAFGLMLRATVRELRAAAVPDAPPWIALTRKAALIAIYTICFRALLDVKSHDWSFYLLVTIAAASGAMLRARLPSSPDVELERPGAALEEPATNRLAA
jgi:O-antigen ligase